MCSPYIDIDSILMTRKIDTERHPQQNTVNLRLLFLGDKAEHFVVKTQRNSTQLNSTQSNHSSTQPNIT